MIEHKDSEVRTFHFENLSNERGLTNFISTRLGGVSEPPYNELNFSFNVGDKADSVLENRKRLMQNLGIPLEWLVACKQIHKGNVTVVTKEMRGRGAFSRESAIEATDALVTNDKDVCLIVMLADCVPVILFDRKKRIVGVAHAGWKGTVRGSTSNTVKTMMKTFGSNPTDILAGIGPSIGPESYEVGPEVIEIVNSTFQGDKALIREGKNGKGFFDLWTANQHQLLDVGIPRENIEIAGISTYLLDDVFFSERRQKPTGRFATGVMIRG